MKKIIILGAGIAGISAGFHAQKKYPDTEITIYEKSNDWGGLCGGFYVHSKNGGGANFGLTMPCIYLSLMILIFNRCSQILANQSCTHQTLQIIFKDIG